MNIKEFKDGWKDFFLGMPLDVSKPESWISGWEVAFDVLAEVSAYEDTNTRLPDERKLFDSWFKEYKSLNELINTTYVQEAFDPWKAWKERADMDSKSARFWGRIAGIAVSERLKIEDEFIKYKEENK